MEGKDIAQADTPSMKYFHHPYLAEFKKEQLDPCFTKVVTEKPKSSRAESSEAYFVCLGYKGRADSSGST